MVDPLQKKFFRNRREAFVISQQNQLVSVALAPMDRSPQARNLVDMLKLRNAGKGGGGGLVLLHSHLERPPVS